MRKVKETFALPALFYSSPTLLQIPNTLTTLLHAQPLPAALPLSLTPSPVHILLLCLCLALKLLAERVSGWQRQKENVSTEINDFLFAASFSFHVFFFTFRFPFFLPFFICASLQMFAYILVAFFSRSGVALALHIAHLSSVWRLGPCPCHAYSHQTTAAAPAADEW